MKSDKLVKVLFRQIDESGELEVESVWASKSKSFYQIENIPFFIMGISYRDIVEVKEIEGELHANRIIKESGNSTVRIYLNSTDKINIVREELKSLGCSFELGFKKVLAVNISPEIDYLPIRVYLEKGESKNLWEYDEGCLADNHQL